MAITSVPQVRVFLSSTMVDLRAERGALDEALTRLGIFDVIRAEALPAVEDPSQIVCLNEVASADAVILVLGARYGYVPGAQNPEGLSVTHLEYRHARATRRPVLVFVQACAEREEGLARFMEEVGAFSKGSFWKEWVTTEDLTHEVQRALLHWLARRARAGSLGGEPEATKRALRTITATVERVDVAIDGTVAPALPQGVTEWKEVVARTLEQLAQTYVVPLVLVEPSHESGRPAVRVSVCTREDGRVECHLSASPLPQSREGPDGAIVLQLSLSTTRDGAEVLAQIIAALTLLLSEDAPHAIALAIALLEHPELDTDGRGNVARVAASASLLEEGLEATTIARALLDRGVSDSQAVSTTVIALTVERARYKRRGARRAAARARWETVRLLTREIGTRRLNADELYNLARSLIDSSTALYLYELLLREYPELEERWYVRRDLGLVLYHGGQHERAAREYLQAAELRKSDGMLFRYAADARYYAGEWAEALPLYLRAMALDDTEDYFVADKIWYIRRRLSTATSRVRSVRARRSLSRALYATGELAARFHIPVESWFQTLALRVWDLNANASRELALRASRGGAYTVAVGLLRLQLAAIPENPRARVNLVADMIYSAGGALTSEARDQLRRAFFHGGAWTEEYFATCLANTSEAGALLQEGWVVREEASVAAENRRERRATLLQAEQFGTTIHLELTD